MYTVRKLGLWILMVGCLITMTVSSAKAVKRETIAVQSSASSAVLYEPSSGRILYEKQAHVKRPMASTTKLMTALIAVERLPVNAVLTATAEALAVEGSSMGLSVGDAISRNDLLYGLLLSSGNDAANVIALSVADSYEEFAVLMNDKAVSLGMTDTCFVTPSGLDEGEHGSSAYDMALLAAEVLQNKLLAEICATTSRTITVGDRTVGLQNHNKLLSQYDGCVGMKTGYTSKAGRCLVSAATRDGVTLIAVTLNCRNDWEEHKTMFDEGFALTEQVLLSPPSLPSLTVYGGAESLLPVSSPSTSVTLLKGDAASLETTILLERGRWAPVSKGDVVGTVQYHLRGAVIKTVPITAVSGVPIRERESLLVRTWRLFMMLLKETVT